MRIIKSGSVILLAFIHSIHRSSMHKHNEFLCVSDLSTTNQTILLKTPTRINFFYKPDTNFKNIIFYLLEMPVMYTGLYRVTMISLLMTLVFTACSQLAILSRTVEQIIPGRNYHIFHKIVSKHLHIISMTQSIGRGFDYLLLFELIVTTVLLGLIAYNGILNFDKADKLSLLSIVIYGSTMLIVIFGNCLIGEYLIQESTNLHKSFAKCVWYEMPIFHRKCLLMCLNNSNTPLYITAGKFYIFSLSGYTSQILKTSMAYFSMLRTLTKN
uniref:Olfactory receptor 29 n=2 Tax=Meteorus pulchricornis TaxID=51522 RepID=A0A1S5VFL8_9HYME|nr:olfactory receptor 29 [Meteorus pulchricornis]